MNEVTALMDLSVTDACSATHDQSVPNVCTPLLYLSLSVSLSLSLSLSLFQSLLACYRPAHWILNINIHRILKRYVRDRSAGLFH